MEILGIIGFSIAVLVTPIYLLLIGKGVRSLSDLRNMLTKPPRDHDTRRTERH